MQTRAKTAPIVGALVAHDAGGAGGHSDPSRLNDAGLAAKVQSEVFRDERSPREDIVREVESVKGVRGVRNLLHQPGEPAPTKA